MTDLVRDGGAHPRPLGILRLRGTSLSEIHDASRSRRTQWPFADHLSTRIPRNHAAQRLAATWKASCAAWSAAASDGRYHAHWEKCRVVQ
jgi:hypothetical protein